MIAIVSGGEDKRIEFGVAELEKVLAAKGLKSKRVGSPEEAPKELAVVVGCAETNRWLKAEVEEERLAIPDAAESYAINAVSVDGKDLIVAAGRDGTGAMYAALELAEVFDRQATGFDPLAVVPEKSSSPMLKVRGVNFYITLEGLEGKESWYHSPDFWRGYFDMMARCRLNFLDLHAVWVASHGTIGTNLFPYIIQTPSFPKILAADAAQVKKNLDVLKNVTRMAKERGIEVCVANQMGNVYSDAKSAGLTDEELYKYTKECVQVLLESCPDLGAIGVRVAESGKGEDFYKGCYLEGIRASGRLVRLVVRTWGARKEKIEEMAREYPGEVSAEIKYNGEQLGLPYQAVTDESQQGLAGNLVGASYTYQGHTVGKRSYSIIWQIRANGTHRIFRWGDPNFVRRCVKTCLFGGGLGFSLECLLGMIFQEDFCQREGYKSYRWNFERDWYWFLLWGRLAYDPATSADVWLAEFNKRFGPKAGHSVCNAYYHGSQIVPLIYAYHKFGMDSRHIAPEMELGGGLATTTRVIPLDPNTLQAIPEYVQDCLNGRASGKRSPIQVASTLRDEANACLETVWWHGDVNIDPDNKEWKSTRLDMEALAYLGHYYAEKILAATHLKFYLLTQDRSRYELAEDHAARSAYWWGKLADVTDRQYHAFPDFRLGMMYWHDPLAPVSWGSQMNMETVLRESLTLLHMIRDPFPPQVEHTPASGAVAEKPFQVQARVTDTSGIAWVKLHYKPIPTMYRWKCTEMTEEEDGVYRATVPANEVTGEGVMYYIEAADNDDNGTIFPNPARETPYIIVNASA